jgi:hypothetical protein
MSLLSPSDMPGFGVAFLLVLLLGLLAPFVLYYLISAETSDQQTLDRTDAERIARQDDPPDEGG